MARLGRPPIDDPRSVTVRYRLTEKEAATLARAAALMGMSVTEFARASSLVSAQRRVRKGLKLADEVP